MKPLIDAHKLSLNRITFSPKIQWLESEKMRQSLLLNQQSCTSFILENIPEHYFVKDSTIKEQPLFPGDIQELQRQKSEMLIDTTVSDWLMLMRDEENTIREKAALFWHHHIPSDIHDPISGYDLLEIYRKYALGNLRELLYEIISNRSFLFYLTGIRSHKDKPNENLARELLELYTLGDGHYSQADIVEIARALTGVSRPAEDLSIHIHEDKIDRGIKNILGKKGHFDRYDVIDIILQQEQTAIHIVKSALKFYVCDNPLDIHIHACAREYRDSGYNFLHLLKYILTSDWFYQTAAYRTKVKTPVELFIGFQRQTGYKLIGTKAHKKVMELLGQQLFMPYNVSGWPNGELWLQGSFRLSRKFLLLSLLDIANRPFEKGSLEYKIFSRIIKPNLEFAEKCLASH
jgi:uncharacterized protein (DUF1800 family)